MSRALRPCGTVAALRRHQRRGETPCQPCRDAHSSLTRRVRRERREAAPVFVPSVGAVRRAQALAVDGYTANTIAAESFVHPSYLRHLWQGEYATVFAGTHRAVAATYEKLAGTGGPSVITARRAQRAGWAPWYAWDDDTIDDPDARPNLTGFDESTVRALMRGEDVESDRVDRREAAARLLARQHAPADIAAMLRVDPTTVYVYLREAA